MSICVWRYLFPLELTISPRSLYLCDIKFHTEALSELLESDQRFGFIVMDGNGSLFGTLAGNTREIIHKFTVDLPKKHGRGGQSALRFSRLRDEKRHNYVRKVAELAVQHYITQDKVCKTGASMASDTAGISRSYEGRAQLQPTPPHHEDVLSAKYSGMSFEWALRDRS